MKKIKIIFYFLVCFLLMGHVKANTLHSLDVNVKLDEKGNGHVTEIWDLEANSGTESYHSFGNMNGRSIYNYKVSMDDIPYTKLLIWNTEGTRDDKAYKNGINYVNNGLELCHGIEYGRHTYIVNYVINNLVWQYDDNQILYFSFLPKNMRQAPKQFSLTLEGYKPFSNIKYSSYGFVSNNKINDGKIILKSKGSMKSSEYVVALVGFPNGTFSLTTVKNGTYNDMASDALKGTKENNFITWQFYLIAFVIWIILYFGLKFMFRLVSYHVSKVFKIIHEHYDKTEYKIPKLVNNYRGIPFEGDIILSYFIGQYHGIIKKKNLIGTCLLMLVKDYNIKIVPIKKNKCYLDLTNMVLPDNVVVKNLTVYLKAASNDNTLTIKQFKKWCKDNSEIIVDWFDYAKKYSRNKLIEKGYIICTDASSKKKIYKFTSKLQEEVIKLKGLKQFLNNMTLIDEKRAVEVQLWDDYLIFAQAFGIADKVANQFKDIYPHQYVEADYFAYTTFSTGFSHTATRIGLMSAPKIRGISTSASSGGSFSGGGSSSGGFSSGGGGVR